MSKSPFDLEAVRRNWARSIAPPKTEIPAHLATVKPPRNVPADIMTILLRVRDLTKQSFPEQASTFEPFFTEAIRLAKQLPNADASAKDDPTKTLLTLLNDMEELFDAFTILRR